MKILKLLILLILRMNVSKKILVPIAQGTEEMEAVIIIDMMRRAGFKVIVAAENEIITCSRGIKIIPDV